MKKLYLIAFLLFSIAPVISSQGTLRGKITDQNGEALIGATIVLKTSIISGTVSDFDGNYSLQVPGTISYALEVRSIGYSTISDTITVRKGEVLVRNYEMDVESKALAEVTITAKASKSRDNYMEKIKVKSASVIDFISTETIKKTGDSNVSAAVSRISGVSTHSGYITVRGISDRYVKTSINGLRIPTLDPFTNNIKLDLFPASLIDNIVLTKTESADLPGDWAGAYLSIETVDFPEKFAFSFETAAGYNTGATFRNVISSERSATDWLGFDNGLRNIDHIPTAYNELLNLDYKEFCALGLKDFFNSMGITENTLFLDSYRSLALAELGFLGKARVNDPLALAEATKLYNSSDLKQEALLSATALEVSMARSLANTWSTFYSKAPVDFSQSISVGDQKSLAAGGSLGYLIGMRYFMTTQYDDNTTYGRIDAPAVEPLNIEDPYLLYDAFGIGELSIVTNGWSAILNTSLKFNPNNSISFIFMPNVLGVNKARMDRNVSITSGSPISWTTMAQYYESRKQMVYQLKSQHFIPSIKSKLEFNASYTSGNSNAPDYRQFSYVLDPLTNDIQRMHIKKYSNNRVFQDLSEDLFDSNASVEFPLSDSPGLVRRAKFGGAFQRLVRKAEQHSYLLPQDIALQKIFNNDIPGFLSLDSFALDNGVIKRYYLNEAGPANNTIGISEVFAGFGLLEYSFSEAFRVSGGIRMEHLHMHTDRYDFYEQQLARMDDRRINFSDVLLRRYNPGLLDDMFFLPSASIVYRLNKDEQAPFNLRANYSKTIAPPSLRELTPFRVFDFSLLGLVTGNDELETAQIHNYDIRSELYFKRGDNLSLSLFHKDFINHIEMIREDFDETYYSWQNAGKSSVTGIEFESHLNLVKNLEFRLNTTLVESRTLVSSDSVPRAMFGQAPYIINGMLIFNSPKLKTEATISYNIQGPKLVIAGSLGRADVYELPRHMIDIKLNRKLGNNFGLSLKIRDLLGTSIVRAYKFPTGWLDFDRYTFGASYQLALSYSFN